MFKIALTWGLIALLGRPVPFAQAVFPWVSARWLRGVAYRERRGVKVASVDRRDVWASDRSWKRAVRVGWVDPSCQPKTAQWSTRGSWGLIAAYHVRYLPGRCWPPWVLDLPHVSVLVATAKLERICRADWKVHPRTARWATLRVPKPTCP